MNYLFDENKVTPLCEIMCRHGSDKGSISTGVHNYTTFYYSIFKDLCDKNLRVFELGLGTNNVNIPSNMGPHGKPGASLYGWQEFFPKSKIFGADIDRDILFDTGNIKTFYCDQTDPLKIKSMWSDPKLKKKFDIIIEDGLHEFDAHVCFFENSIHKLNPNGYFIIENIKIHNEPLFISKIKEWELKYQNYVFDFLKIPNSNNVYHDNNLLVIKRQY